MRWNRFALLLAIMAIALMCFSGISHSGTPRQNNRKVALRIFRLYPDEFNDELIIYGQFGTRAGEVLMNGKPLKLDKPWAQTELVCALPRSGDQAAGNVVAKVGADTSNTALLTEWRGTFTYDRVTSLDVGPIGDAVLGFGCLQEAVVNLHIRADLHPVDSSQNVGPDPLAQLGSVYPEGIYFVAARDSTCTLKAEGEGDMETPQGSNHLTFISKNNFPPLWKKGETEHDTPYGFEAMGSIDVSKKRIYVDINEASPGGGEVISSRLKPTRTTFPISFATHDVIDPLDPNVDEIAVSLADNFNIKAGRATRPEPNLPPELKKEVQELQRALRPLTPGSRPTSLEWGNIVARFPPE